ncbi:MAG: DNA polymerase III subunit delta [Candidatus Azobacteroides sp.]|nr:DNA polymerase III subunit delta [Candidatus Azobacteroides sp.]
MFFRDIIGQEEIKLRFIRSVETEQIPHAQLLAGKEGVGKYALALALAQYVNCTDRKDGDSCGVCPSCVKMNKLIHPDLHFVFPIVKNEKSKRTVCDDFLPEWRNFLLTNTYFTYNQWLDAMGESNKQALIYTKESEEILRKLNLKTFEADYKTMIIWLPEKMHQDCANKLLKILEEPPAKTLFLLITEQPDEILLTIQSRSQRINVKSIHPERIMEKLHQDFSLEESECRAIAHIADGSFTRALETIYLNEQNQFFFEQFTHLMRSAYRVGAIKDPVEKNVGLRGLKSWADTMAGEGRERQKAFFTYCQRLLRENFIFNIQQPALNYMTQKEEEFSSRFAPFIHEKNVSGLMEEFALAEAHVSQNINAKMVFFDLALKTIMLLLKR